MLNDSSVANSGDVQRTASVFDSLQRAASLMPEKVGIADPWVSLSYSEFRDDALKIGGLLQSLGVNHGDRVVVLARTSAFHICAWYGVIAAAATVVDLNPRLTFAELAPIVAHTRPVAVITDDGFASIGQELAAHFAPDLAFVRISQTKRGSGDLDFESNRESLVAPEKTPEQAVATISYTSGTTGVPRGVCLTHRNHLENAKNYIIALQHAPSDSYLHIAPMHHTGGTMNAVSMTWLGATQVFLPEFAPTTFFDTMERWDISFTLLVPTLVQILVKEQQRTAVTSRPAAWRKTLYGTAPMPLWLVRDAMQTFPGEWFQGYGTTETSPLATVLSSADHETGDPEILGSAGRPMLGVDVSIVRADGTLADRGEPGEVCVGGPTVMAGYWNDPESTSRAMTVDGRYRTGDIGVMSAKGYLTLLDRLKDMVIVGGENVFSVEVERVLTEHPDVDEVGVVGLPDRLRGERVHAEVVLRPEATVTSRELLRSTHDQLAAWKRPKSLNIRDSPLPKNSGGKVDKRVLREEARQPRPPRSEDD